MKTLSTILLFLFCLQSFGQKKEPFISGKDIAIYSLQFLSGASDGVNQSIIYHHLGAGKPFWDYNTSWKRKYKDWDGGDTRAAYFGSKSIFISFTDGNHLTRLASRAFFTGSIMIAMSEHDSWKEIIREVIIASLINRAGFTLMYDGILKGKR